MVLMTPLSTYLGSNLINTFDASQHVFSDSGKTAACVNDDPVYHWGTAGGISSLDCSQATLAKRPLWKSNYDGLGYPALLLDGTDDWMQIASNGDANYTSDFFAFVVGRVLSFSTRTFAGRSVTGGFQFGFHTSSTAISSQLHTSAGTVNAGCIFSESPADGVFGVGFNQGRSVAIAAASLQSLYNGAATAPAATSNWYLGSYNGGSLLGQIAVRAFVLCKGLTLAQVTAVRQWLSYAYGYHDQISSGGTAGFTGLSGVGRLGT